MLEVSEALTDFLRGGIEQRDLNGKSRSVKCDVVVRNEPGIRTYGQNLRIDRRKIASVAFSAKSFLRGSSQLEDWAEQKGEESLIKYRQTHNSRSIDRLEGIA